jgi:hypothetical protein
MVMPHFTSCSACCGQAIDRAHENVAPGRLQISAGELLDANINRSPTAYLANPAAERARFAHDTDKTMMLLKVLDDEGRCARLCLPWHISYQAQSADYITVFLYVIVGVWIIAPCFRIHASYLFQQYTCPWQLAEARI